MRSSSAPIRIMLAGIRAAPLRRRLDEPRAAAQRHAPVDWRARVVRSAIAAACLSFLLCAPAPKTAPPQEPFITIEGEVALAGPSYSDRTLVLTDAGGGVCTLSSPRFEYELRRLAGHRVLVTGRLAGKTEDVPEFIVERYAMAAVGGRAPVIGTLVYLDAGMLLVDASRGIEYALTGPLEEALRSFVGYKVWLDGPVLPYVSERGAGGMITVESYGVLAPPAASAPAEPGASDLLLLQSGVPAAPADTTSVRP